MRSPPSPHHSQRPSDCGWALPWRPACFGGGMDGRGGRWITLSGVERSGPFDPPASKRWHSSCAWLSRWRARVSAREWYRRPRGALHWCCCVDDVPGSMPLVFRTPLRLPASIASPWRRATIRHPVLAPARESCSSRLFSLQSKNDIRARLVARKAKSVTGARPNTERCTPNRLPLKSSSGHQATAIVSIACFRFLLVTSLARWARSGQGPANGGCPGSGRKATLHPTSSDRQKKTLHGAGT